MPQIKIVSPSQGQQVLGDKVTVSFIVGDFTVGADGYLYLWLDNPIEEASTAAKITSQFDYSLSDLAAGPHKLTLEAVKTNKLSFNPPVKQTIFFTTLPAQIPTITPTPTPVNIISLVSFLNWQYIVIIFSVLIIAAGLVVKSTFGKPKIWEN